MQKEKQEAAILAAADACRGLNAVIATRTSSVHEFADIPSWACFALTDKLIDALLQVRGMVASRPLADIGIYHDCEVGTSDDGEMYRTDLSRLRVFAGGYFRLEANIRNTDVQFVSTLLFFESFFEEVAAGRRFFASEDHDDELDADLEQTIEDDVGGLQGVMDACRQKAA